ncbi:class I SAM-dependent methyltransferase [Streptomyces sp. NHF165]|uniref:class I SAM-dependent methyltransferase n=1 Tax=Streptomyces sp. NHF165 TaxID=2175864 RepID=UPI001F41A8D7|nr:class I SAM-dependent methyltransferase [Streptomyces sp. NHF165]
MLDHLVETAGARSAHGLEPDPEMCRYVKQHAGPGVSVENIGWEDFVPDRRFDAVVGVSVLEYAARSPSPSPQEEIDALREFFRRAHMDRPGRLPRAGSDHRRSRGAEREIRTG